MNRDRRKEVERAIAMISEAAQILSTCADEEEEYYDNMPESIQSGEKGDRATECATALQEAADAAEEAANQAQEAIES